LATLTPSHVSPVKLFGIRTSIIAAAALLALLYYGRDFFVTLIIAAVFALILEPAVVLVMRLRLPRPVSTGIVLGAACVGIGFIAALGWNQLANLAEDLPTYSSRISELWDKTTDQLEHVEKSTLEVLVPKRLRQQGEQIQQKPQQAMQSRRRRSPVTPVPVPAQPVVQEVRIHSDPKPLIITLYSFSSQYFHMLFLASFVPFLVYFMLSWGDHISNSVMRLFQGQQHYVVGRSLAGIGHTTRAFVLGNFLLWILLGSISSVAFFFLGIPYWALIGFASALFSLLPYAGLPLSAVPPLLAAVAIPNHFKVILLTLVVTVSLHLIAMNLLYAKIVGRRVHLNPLVVTISLMFWGLIWGSVGLVLAIPIMAGIKTVCDNVEGLEPYGRLLGE
jgi:predicted PurR-regulated permease PerM